jgi:hypothetical protein
MGLSIRVDVYLGSSKLDGVITNQAEKQYGHEDTGLRRYLWRAERRLLLEGAHVG